ncbi:MAG: molybdopterin molybdotransferase MoeA [Chitinophagaceae bacterium]|nr:molybdopterin molybdotransferase MoeA [Chitinophagaceae bacterium]MCB9044800.1 molybdopterin molybdotransferase MoeA [Chitinophagales bacterium]
MTSVAAAEHIILSEKKDYGTELVGIRQATGRVLAEDIGADRDFPPYDRVTMDGIAILFEAYEKGNRTFRIKGTQQAGDAPIAIESDGECVEIMTGAALPDITDTVIRYEDLEINDGHATIVTDNIRQGKNIHYKGSDKIENQLLVAANCVITPAIINVAASVGKSQLLVKKLPRVGVLSTGNELVPIEQTPSPTEVRRSNTYAIASVLQQYHIQADMLHIPDDEAIILSALSKCLQEYDVLILSGGVSMGKYDYLPEAFAKLDVEKRFHKVRQRPGKPFWFGASPEEKIVFAFPGNPVSTFMCMYRYFVPWLQASLGMEQSKPLYAVLDRDYMFKPELQYFLQVKINSTEDGCLIATPSEGNGSGDFVNLLYTDAFMELPEHKTNFTEGEAYRIWPYKTII